MKKVECLSIILNSIIGIPDISFVFLNYSPGLELHICLFKFDKGQTSLAYDVKPYMRRKMRSAIRPYVLKLINLINIPYIITW